MGFTFVQAGAGCGKTTWIIEQILRLAKNKNQYYNKKILVITYTNSAVEELKNRLKDRWPDLQKFVDVFTFHSMCCQYISLDGVFSEHTNLELLLSYGGELYESSFEEFYNYYLCHRPISKEDYLKNLDIYYKDAKKMDTIHSINLEDFIGVDGGFRKKKPPHIRDENWWNDRKQQLGLHFDFLKKQHNLVYFKRCLLVEEIRSHLKIYTYQHIVLRVLDNLYEFLRIIYGKYINIFIDEVQDLSHIQFKIIKALSEELPYNLDHNITIVGDVHQSIYSFQGANEDNFYRFLEDIKSIPHLNYQEILLKKTYRFGGKILSFVNEMFYEHSSDMVDGEVHLYPLCKDVDSLVDVIKGAVANKTGSVLVLFQRRSSLTVKLEGQLKSVKMVHKISHQDEMLTAFFSLISYIVTENENHLINFLLGIMFVIPEPEFYNFIQKYRNNVFQGLEEQYGTKKEFILLKQLRLVKTTEDFLNLFIGSIFHQMAYGYYGSNINMLLAELKKLVKVQSIPISNLLFLENKDLWLEKEGSLHLSTVHNSKGMEADHVFIIDGNVGVQKQSMTLFNNCPFYNFFTMAKHEEFNNLLYVAITRAKRDLHIFGQGTKINENSLYDLCHQWQKTQQDTRQE